MKKRVFSAEFKAERVLEVLRGEKEIKEIASVHEIAPQPASELVVTPEILNSDQGQPIYKPGIY